MGWAFQNVLKARLIDSRLFPVDKVTLVVGNGWFGHDSERRLMIFFSALSGGLGFPWVREGSEVDLLTTYACVGSVGPRSIQMNSHREGSVAKINGGDLPVLPGSPVDKPPNVIALNFE